MMNDQKSYILMQISAKSYVIRPNLFCYLSLFRLLITE